jgi:hypothetical protein
LSPAKQELLAKRVLGKRATETIARRRNGEPIPLSFTQQRLWFLNRLEPDNAIYNVPAAVRLQGNLNVEALERTLSEIIRRHESLRTTFIEVNGSPVQVINPAGSVKLTHSDLTAWPTAEREVRARELARAEARRPFDLSQGPLLRVTLMRLDEDKFLALLNLHHIVSDGVSMGLLVQEIMSIYQAFRVGEPSPLPELPAQYADFAVWQSGQLQGEVLEREMSFWRRELGGELPRLNLKSDGPRAAETSHKGASVPLKLSPQLTEDVRSFCRREGVTMFMTLLAAYMTLLHCFSGQTDIIVGSPISQRKRARFEGLIGCFINTLVLRTSLEGDPDFRALLERVKETALNAYNHSNVPFDKIVEELQPRGSRGQTPIFQVWMNLEKSSAVELRLPELTLSTFPQEKQWSKFDLALLIQDRSDIIDCVLEYNADLLEANTVSRYASAFETIVSTVVAEPATKLSSLNEKLAEQDRQTRLLEEREYQDSIKRKLSGVRRRAV